MKLRINAYDFQTNSTYIGTRARMRRSSNGLPYMIEQEIDIEGDLLVSSSSLTDLSGQQELTTLENNLREALKARNLDVTFFRDDNLASSIVVLSSNTIGGVQVLDGPDFPGNDPGEYAVKRKFKLRLGFATRFDSSTANFVVSFNEKISTSGGGPIYKFKRAVKGPAQKQRIFEQTEYQVIQTGEVVGFTDYINPPAPLFPNDLIENPDKNREGSERVGDSNINFRLSYKYLMAATRPLNATPNLWVQL